MLILKIWALIGMSVYLSSCGLAPIYHRPNMPIPKEFLQAGHWHARHKVSHIQTTPWWQTFRDPELNLLEQQLSVANQNIAGAYARFQQAQATAHVARARFFPAIDGFINADRQQNSLTTANLASQPRYNEWLLGGQLSYELDVWGRVRNDFVANQQLTRASYFDMAALSLSMHAALAQDYITLRGDEQAQLVLNKTVVAYQKALQLIRYRFNGGASPIADVYEAKLQLENAKTMATQMQLNRAQLTHAIAILVGQFPENFKLTHQHTPIHNPEIALHLPSTLLERRPDIAAREAQVIAANARIGVARAAFFPTFDLVSTGGFNSQKITNLLTLSSLFWSLGPASLLSLSQPLASVVLFDGGKLQALLAKAQADYYETLANYQQTVRRAFQETEDSLVAIRRLNQAYQSQQAATQAAQHTLIQAKARYNAGIVTFLDVVIFENTALQAQLNLINIQTRQKLASLQLIKALGGIF